MIWYIIIALVFVLLLWILLGPVMLTLDTTRNRYRFILPGVVSVSLVPAAGFFRIHGWIFFVPFRLDPLKMGKSKKRGKKKEKAANRDSEENAGKSMLKYTEKKEKKSGRKKGLKQMKKFRHVTRAIRVRRLELDIDTDDFLLNAWLVPAFVAVNSYENVQLNVNFEGNLSLQMDLRTRVGAVMWRYFQAR